MLSNRSIVWIRLLRRYLLEESGPAADEERASVSKMIQPITDADMLLRDFKTASVLLDISGGAVTAFTVPPKKRWYVSVITKDSTTVNAAGMHLSYQGINCRIMTQTTGGQVVLPPHLVLSEGTLIKADGGNIADTVIGYAITYEEEEAF